MGSRLFDEIREKRGLCYSVYAIDHAFADVPILQLGSGPRVGQVRRGLHAHARDRGRAARATGPPRRRSRARAPTPPADSCSRSRTPARSRATRASQRIVFGEDIDPDAAIAALDAVTSREVREVAARASPTHLAVACVGPHTRRGVLSRRAQPIATMRSIGTRARCGDLRGHAHLVAASSRSESRSFGSVIIFMYAHVASGLAGMKLTSGAAICSG